MATAPKTLRTFKITDKAFASYQESKATGELTQEQWFKVAAKLINKHHKPF